MWGLSVINWGKLSSLFVQRKRSSFSPGRGAIFHGRIMICFRGEEWRRGSKWTSHFCCFLKFFSLTCSICQCAVLWESLCWIPPGCCVRIYCREATAGTWTGQKASRHFVKEFKSVCPLLQASEKNIIFSILPFLTIIFNAATCPFPTLQTKLPAWDAKTLTPSNLLDNFSV